MLELMLSGSPEDMGRQHGETFRTKIQELCVNRFDLLASCFANEERGALEVVIANQVDKLNDCPILKKELEAIAVGAKVSLADLVVLNDFTDLRDFSWKKNSGEVEGCSTFCLPNDLGWIYGQSWDMHSSSQEYLCHITINNKPKIELFSLVGCLGIAGTNGYGLSVFVNNLRCTQVDPGVMWSAVVRLMLQERDVESAIKVLQSNLPSSGRNYLIVDRNKAVNVETTGETLEVIRQKSPNSVLFHTNHYLGKLKKYEYIDNLNVTTQWRYKRLDSFFSMPKINLTAEQLAQNLLIKKSSFSVYVPGDGKKNTFKTCGGFLVDSQNNQFTLFLDAYDSDFRKVVPALDNSDI